jgi:glycine betaine/choline ABC-type transport system substrate-binding protein
VRGLNERVDGEKADPADVAQSFLSGHGLV